MSNASRCVTVFTQRSEHSCVSSVREFCCSDGDYDDDDSISIDGWQIYHAQHDMLVKSSLSCLDQITSLAKLQIILSQSHTKTTALSGGPSNRVR